MDAHEDEPPVIDATLDPVRAAISLVADGIARRVTVNHPDAATLMPAARQLARAAGVRVELVHGDERDDLMILRDLAQGA
jgi:hypothetical protein